MDLNYLNDSIQIVMNNIGKLPDAAIDEMYKRVLEEVERRNLGIYTQFEEL